LHAAVPGAIARRLVGRASGDLPHWDEADFSVRELPVDQGPGVILLLEAAYEHVTEVVSGFGQMGVTAERLARTASARMRGYEESTAFAGPYLADQLVLPFVLAGGGLFTTVKPSGHTRTALDIAAAFTGRRASLTRLPGGEHRVAFG
ncbi:RNA 3'-terminal phosphate cyclase, partial [Novosphingobium sp. 1949]|nr:RNA 3'-terminal phosphate cyclase [Novosphingobium organovorum]